ncbi:bifunctional diguanylate cyclase/phosphodiesterase [uncultured Roseovarius sp.]|uniref:putative bifunctional diguanylate cyclase/phosphodiesterase n=1 Tax=uncultured Roseovarius sp. TaxID=293344 RepID=UPI00260CCD5C|nr:bifunctional diguanylate cyclase/phosphodiesterase [uncultured Roseovarius sp.]
MYRQLSRLNSTIRSSFKAILHGPQILAFLPAFVLAGYWIGGELVLTATAIGFPAVIAIFAMMQPLNGKNRRADKRDRKPRPDEFNLALDRALRLARKKDLKTACLVLGLDDFDAIIDRYGRSVALEVVEELCERVNSAVRSRDSVSRLDDHKFGVMIAPVGHMNLDIALQLASRLQAAVEQPIQLGGTTIYISTSVGFCLDTNFRDNNGKLMAEAADLALTVAQRNGPSSIRAYSPDMRDIKVNPHTISTEIDQALESGQIIPWFQPQISTDTGYVTGFEALARWEHPERGIISPAEFLPKIQQAGEMERLSEVMLTGALAALNFWDADGVDVPRVGVNFSPDELRNPRLLQKIEWELDKFDLTTDRLAIEILETVVATSPDDMVARNISGLSEMGCQIDLDDFGTGHASISSIRRFDIQRLKIDRSFVMKVDQDPEQQRMVSAILLMAERLELDTLAEGVETAGEHAMLAQLGCRHVQGFGIGRPMALENTLEWIAAHLANLSDPPTIGFKTG